MRNLFLASAPAAELHRPREREDHGVDRSLIIPRVRMKIFYIPFTLRICNWARCYVSTPPPTPGFVFQLGCAPCRLPPSFVFSSRSLPRSGLPPCWQLSLTCYAGTPLVHQSFLGRNFAVRLGPVARHNELRTGKLFVYVASVAGALFQRRYADPDPCAFGSPAI